MLIPKHPPISSLSPKKPIPKLEEASESDRDLLGHLLLTVKKVAAEAKLSQGYRVVINNGEHGGQTVDHLHVHLLGDRPMDWPPG